MVIKMEFGEDAENAEPSEEIGLAARLSKKTKTQAKEKGVNNSFFFLICVLISGIISLIVCINAPFQLKKNISKFLELIVNLYDQNII